MQEQSIVADERQEKITRLCLILAGVDGIIALVTIVIPLIVLGEKAWTEQALRFIVPFCGGMAITAIFFVYSIQKIDSR